MRVFFIVFIFISAIAMYPKIVSLYLTSSLPVSASGSSIVADSEKIYKKIRYLVEDDDSPPVTPAGLAKKIDKTNKTKQTKKIIQSGGDDDYGEGDDDYIPTVVVNTKRIGIQHKSVASKIYKKSTPSVSKKINYKSKYKNGNYKGIAANAYYGYVQVEAVVRNGKISHIKILRSPNNSQNSVYLNSQALPYLKQEMIQKQNGKVDVVSGATYTSMAFIQSAKSALSKALN